jgi:hypothetical protein
LLNTLSIAQTQEEVQLKVLNLSCKVDSLGFSVSEMTGCMLED